MRSRIPKGFENFLAHHCETLDKSIPQLRTMFLVTGLAAAALQTGALADVLFVNGLLLQFSIWFEHWWKRPRSH